MRQKLLLLLQNCSSLINTFIVSFALCCDSIIVNLSVSSISNGCSFSRASNRCCSRQVRSTDRRHRIHHLLFLIIVGRFNTLYFASHQKTVPPYLYRLHPLRFHLWTTHLQMPHRAVIRVPFSPVSFYDYGKMRAFYGRMSKSLSTALTLSHRLHCAAKKRLQNHRLFYFLLPFQFSFTVECISCNNNN